MAVALPLPHTACGPVLESDDLLAFVVVEDFNHNLGTVDVRGADFAVVARAKENLIDVDAGADFDVHSVDNNLVACGDAVLLAAVGHDPCS